MSTQGKWNRSSSAKVCVIGAGPSGITAAKTLLDAGIRNVTIYDKNDQIGGNWIYSPRLSHSSVFRTTHIISSKKLSQYSDYPMPDDYPDYPSHYELKEYFQAYAREFGVDDLIEFETEVVKAEPVGNQWELHLGDGRVEVFDHLLVANGHHWDPRLPHYPGEFAGRFMHSHEFKENKEFEDLRILVIGGGNSACDVAVETSRLSKFTAISMRRGYQIIPKYMFGKPSDVVNQRFDFLPNWLRVPMLKMSLNLFRGPIEGFGLQKPDYNLLSAHPTMNSELLYFLKHGKVQPRKDIARFEGKKVVFVDGVEEEYDVIIAATGYKISLPFLDKQLVDYSDGDVPLFRRVFHPEMQNLYFIGLVQPQGCIWPLSEFHGKLVGEYIAGRYDLPQNIQEAIDADVSRIRKRYLHSPRHTVEVDYHEHLRELKQELKKAKVRV